MNSLSPQLRSGTGFSLVELLAVAGILAVLVSLIVPAMSQIQKAGNLTKAGNMLVDSIVLARDAASSRNTFSCVVVTPPTKLPQRVTVLEYRPEKSEWSQISQWAVFPETMRIEDLSAPAVSGSAQSAASQIAPLNLSVLGESVPSDAPLILFYPEGASAFAGGHRLSARQAKQPSGVNPDNFYDVVVNPESKALRVVRP